MDFIFEKIYIETPVDTDNDGKRDLIAAYVRRPVNEEGRPAPVPAVFVANPYMMTCNEDWYDLKDVDKPLKVYPEQDITEEDVCFDFGYDCKYDDENNHIPKRPIKGLAETAPCDESIRNEFECISKLYEHLNERGYATVFSGGLGTRGSDGFTLSGSREEVLAFKSVIDWLNGRATAFTDKENNIEIKADWCTGKVAMSAKSYLGTLCFAVAATGVDGLEAIIPEAGISSWYNYYRNNGLVVAPLGWQGDDIDILSKYCFSRAKDKEDYFSVKDQYEECLKLLREGADRESGNYNRFWDSRNYVKQAGNIKAKAFIIHGLNDWNVKTDQCFDMFEALQKLGKTSRILLHRGEHIYIYDLKGSPALEAIDKWLDWTLKGEENGAEKDPTVLVESNIDPEKWLATDVWPPEGTEFRDFPIEKVDNAVITDDLSKTPFKKELDNLLEWRDDLVLNGNSGTKLSYIWNIPSDHEPLRIAGRVKVRFKAAIDMQTAVLSAMLVDRGIKTRLKTKPYPSADEPFTFPPEDQPSEYRVITRGWMNAQNRDSVYSKRRIVPGEFYEYSFEMIPTDYILDRGSDLQLILYGTDCEETIRQDVVTKITVDQKSIDVKVPVCYLHHSGEGDKQ